MAFAVLLRCERMQCDEWSYVSLTIIAGVDLNATEPTRTSERTIPPWCHAR